MKLHHFAIIVGVFIIVAFILAACIQVSELDATPVSNPASAHCIEQGYALEFRSDDQGNQIGICIFPDGSECEEWAYFKGECTPSAQKQPEKEIGMANPASKYCIEQGYRLEIRSDDQGNQIGVCIFPDGSECEEWAYFRHECRPENATSSITHGINLVKELDLNLTNQIDVINLLHPPAQGADAMGPLAITDPVVIEKIVASLDQNLELRARSDCKSVFVLRFQLSDGRHQEFEYGCDPGKPDFLRGFQELWRGQEALTPIDFNELMAPYLKESFSDPGSGIAPAPQETPIAPSKD